MERPGLQQLLADVRSGKVHVVVVYKVDRLTRSLADFAKIVEVLDCAGASFVSVTQAFNTTTSMGRLTLNVLLSFAQFEREVTAERIRDKIAASRAKGMWMGGALPLGYTVADKKLVPVPEEAETVRRIMRQYLDAANVPELRESLIRAGVTSKRVVSRKGNVRGGGPFSRGALHHLLSNRTYIGEVVHNGKIYPGEHEAIVDRDLFEAVQTKLAERTNVPLVRSGRRNVSLLAGMIRDEHGRPMSPAHTRNHGRRYRYYASNRADDDRYPALRLPAGELDAAVKGALKALLADPHQARALGAHLPPAQQQVLASASGSLAAELDALSVTEIRAIFHHLQLRVVISQHHVEATVSSETLLQHLGFDGGDDAALRLPIAASPRAWGHEARLRLDGPSTKAKGDANLIQMIARGFAARDELLAMSETDVRATTRTRVRHLQRYARLAYLAPDIIRAILDGSQPRHLTARYLLRDAPLPLSWTEQRQALGFPAN